VVCAWSAIILSSCREVLWRVLPSNGKNPHSFNFPRCWKYVVPSGGNNSHLQYIKSGEPVIWPAPSVPQIKSDEVGVYVNLCVVGMACWSSVCVCGAKYLTSDGRCHGRSSFCQNLPRTRRNSRIPRYVICVTWCLVCMTSFTCYFVTKVETGLHVFGHM